LEGVLVVKIAVLVKIVSIVNTVIVVAYAVYVMEEQVLDPLHLLRPLQNLDLTLRQKPLQKTLIQ
jgi:hypothetical protein